MNEFKLKTIVRLFFTTIFLFCILGVMGSSTLPVHPTYGQLLNDLDGDGIQDEMDPRPDNSDIDCITPESPNQLSGINAPLDQGKLLETPGD